jgi:hypothetical protein
MTAPRCPCCPDGIMQERRVVIDTVGPLFERISVCSWCGHVEGDDPTQRRATTLAASQRQFHVEE